MYEMKTAADTLRMLETDKDKGLTRREAMERRAKYGANRLESQEQKSLGQMIAEQLNDPLILILVVAMAISLMLHELGDAVIIVTVVVLNAAVGIIQEGKAGKAVEALKKISSPQAVVLREGERVKIAAEELVQGDIVLLEAGNMVPADLRHGGHRRRVYPYGRVCPGGKRSGACGGDIRRQQLHEHGLYVHLCDEGQGHGRSHSHRYGYQDRPHCGYAA